MTQHVPYSLHEVNAVQEKSPWTCIYLVCESWKCHYMLQYQVELNFNGTVKITVTLSDSSCTLSCSLLHLLISVIAVVCLSKDAR